MSKPYINRYEYTAGPYRVFAPQSNTLTTRDLSRKVSAIENFIFH